MSKTCPHFLYGRFRQHLLCLSMAKPPKVLHKVLPGYCPPFVWVWPDSPLILLVGVCHGYIFLCWKKKSAAHFSYMLPKLSALLWTAPLSPLLGETRHNGVPGNGGIRMRKPYVLLFVSGCPLSIILGIFIFSPAFQYVRVNFVFVFPTLSFSSLGFQLHPVALV